MKPRIWPILLASGIGLAILISLGVWQVQRLAWKNALIAKVEASLEGEAELLSALQTRLDKGESVAYAKVRVSGKFQTGPPILVFSTANGGAAWTVTRVFAVKDGPALLIEAGKSLNKSPPAPPSGEVSIEGVVHVHPGYKGYFDPDNQTASGQWYWWDVPAMLKTVTGDKLDQFTVALLPNSPGTEGLIVEPPKVELRNNHLGYAITWFGLAAVLLVMTGVFVGRIVRTR
jgi:surfeit locus 1 family protein